MSVGVHMTKVSVSQPPNAVSFCVPDDFYRVLFSLRYASDNVQLVIVTDDELNTNRVECLVFKDGISELYVLPESRKDALARMSRP